MKNIKIKKTIKRIIAFAMIFAIVAAFAGCGDVPVSKEKYTASIYDTFDTIIQIIAYTKDQAEFDRLENIAEDEFIKYSQYYDIYNDYEGLNNIKTINDNAGIAPVKVDTAIIDLLKFSKELYEKTDGNVNVAFGAVLSLWHDAREYAEVSPENAYIPSEESLKEASLHCSIDDVIIDETAGTVYLADPEMSLDVGSVGKGFATEIIAEVMMAAGCDSFLISAGSSSIKTAGIKGDGSLWHTAIETDPDYDLIKMQDCAITTSGNYQRYYYVDGVRYHHIINKDSLMPENNFTSVTLITDDCGSGDGLATAVYNMSLEEGMKFVNSADGVYAMWVTIDGSKVYSDGFEKFIERD